MAKQQIQVEGLRELSKALRNLEDKELPKQLRLANKKAAEVVAQEAKTRVPVRTGNLQRSIKATASRTSASVKMGSAKVPYAGWIEFGGSIKFKTRDAVLTREVVKGGRYIRPSAQDKHLTIMAIYEREVNEVIGRFNHGSIQV